MKTWRAAFLPALVLSALLPFLLSGCASSAPASSSSTTTPTVTPATVTSVAPAIVPAGAAATVITVTGTNFLSTSVVQVAGVSESTTYVSSTQLQATIPSSLLSTANLLPVAVLNGSTTSATGVAVNLEINNPAPILSSFAPTSFSSGVTGIPLVIAGTGFVPTSGAQIGGSPRPTTYVSPTQLSVALTAADVATPGSLSIQIVNPAPGGGTSAAASVPVNNPAPSGLVLTPSTAIAGSAAVTVTVAGNGFYSGSLVKVNGAARATSFVDGTHLTFQLTATDQAAAATLAITVTNAAPGGGTSTAANLVVSLPTPTPTITSVSPTQLVLGSPDSTIVITGTGYTTKSVVLWNGTALTTTYSAATRLLALVPAAQITTVGTASVTVTTPTATPAASNAVSLAIVVPPAPTLTSISPAAAAINTAAQITLYGTNFTAASTVSFNGTKLTSAYTSSTTLTAQIPATLVTIPGNNFISVTTPAPGGGTSSAVAFTSYVPIASNSMVYNPANGLFYLSIPSSAGTLYGNSVVSVDPATGALGRPIPVGSEPNRLAISSDGTTLWVGLDGASAVREVNLTTGTAGLQFGLGGNSGIYANPPTALALAVLPGSPNSVIASTSSNIGIFDSGVRRGPAPTNNYLYNSGYALQVDGSKSEIYVASQSTYYVYTYNSAGLTLRTTATTGTYSNYASDDLQAIGGRIYADSGHVYDVESGSLLGTFYSSGTTVAGGPIVADTALSKAFILDSPSYASSYSQIQIFNTTDYTSASSSVLPVNGVNTSAGTGYSPSHLTRWGTNGLAFRASNGFFSFRSNLVKDLSSSVADLGVAITPSGASTTGSNSTYTVTVNNAGPSAATNVVLTALIPASGVPVSATPAQGTCSAGVVISCNLGSVANGVFPTIDIVVLQTASGAATLTAQVTGSESDTTLSNNQASSTVTVTGNAYNVIPTIASISPAAILAGSTDTTLTVNGTGFTSATTVLLNGTALSTSVASSTQLTATVPAASIKTLGWATVSVSTPAPGGGTSTTLPLSVYSVITLGVNHILYDPFSRKIMASVGSGSADITGNSIAAITPETATVGTPVSIGSQPTNLALTSDGQILYTILTGSNSIARYNMLTQQADFTYTVPANSSFVGGISLRGIAAQPSTENTIALDIASFTGNAIYDFDPVAKSAAIRGQASGPYSGSCIQFLDATNLFAFDTDTSGATLDHYTVTSAGFTYYNYSQYTQSTLNHFGCFKLNGGLAFANNGGVADPSTVPATQLGVFPTPSGSTFSSLQNVAPDTSLSRVFFLTNTSTTSNYYSTPDGIVAYNQKTFLPSATVPLNMAATEGTSTSYTGVDLIRWGQDGLAALTSGGHIYIMRGPVVVPQLLNQNPAATLTAATPGSLTHGAGNTILTVTGTGFIQGAAVTWNGSYRTTTWVDATHLTVAIPASDLAAAGSATLVVTNPGATASGSITFTIN
jgi:uncharacterized repeat protein (TIGR01451 family)